MAGQRKVDDARLKACVAQVEEKGGLASLGDLWEKAAALYNENVPKDMKALAPSLVRSKVLDEYKLTLKTVNGRAKAAAVNKATLQECIIEVEERGLPRTWSELFSKVAEVYNRQTQQSVSGATLQALAIKEKLEIETPKGKKGGFAEGKRGKRGSRADKFAKSEVAQAAIAQARKDIPSFARKRHLPVVDELAAGSMKAAVKLKCLDCCNFNTAEIKHCESDGCGLWLFRPYQKGDEIEAGDVLEIEQVADEIEEEADKAVA
jgi:hypothetical protein